MGTIVRVIVDYSTVPGRLNLQTLTLAMHEVLATSSPLHKSAELRA
jgi:hypothetical protein